VGVAQFIVIPQPKAAANFSGDHGELEPCLVFARPDAALIEINFSIYSQKTAARVRDLRRAENQRQQQYAAQEPAGNRAGARLGDHTL